MSCVDKEHVDVIKSLVFSGGGTKGVAYLGVLKKIRELREDQHISIEATRIVCVSIGCLFGLVLTLDYDYDEIEEEILNKDFKHLQDIKVSNFATKYGLDSGDNFVSWIETLLIKKGYDKNTTFEELYETTKKHFQVLTTNLNKHAFTFFDYKETPKAKVTDAIRLSVSIPFVFTSHLYEGDVHVDGGLISNFPMYLVEDDIPNVLGIRLVSMEESSNSHRKVDNITDFCINVMSCFMTHREQQSVEANMYKDYTMLVKTGDLTNTINFDMSLPNKRELIMRGYTAADNYFKQRREMTMRLHLQKQKMVDNNKEASCISTDSDAD